ncbi:phospholipase domain-containing protein [Barrientosiimonas endolithica]|uniref:phospholipase domain-containing protein n=1 Tax=Barrientosiimonas endolithica TaxID=1535208 RepID=UPI00259B3322|nr:phospholipase domain-containing protein [Barrientosiimonas endolithica]
MRLSVKALAYKGDSKSVQLQPGKIRDVRWPTDSGWYDLEVTSDHDPKFRCRVTGRVDHPGKPVTA